mgnify:CR=1 FL=1
MQVHPLGVITPQEVYEREKVRTMQIYSSQEIRRDEALIEHSASSMSPDLPLSLAYKKRPRTMQTHYWLRGHSHFSTLGTGSSAGSVARPWV